MAYTPTDLSTMDDTKVEKSDTAKRWFVTALYCLLALGQGTLMVIMGSVLLDLQLLTGATSSDASWILASKPIGFLAALLSINCYFKDRLIILIPLASWLFALSVAATPFCPNVSTLIALNFVHGATACCLSTGGTLTMAAIWKAKKASALYIITFGSYVGYSIGPTLAYPFTIGDKLHKNDTGTAANTTSWAAGGDNISAPSYEALSQTFDHTKEETRWNLFYLFAIVATWVAVFGTLTYILCLSLGKDKLKSAEIETKETKEDMEDAKPTHTPCISRIFVGLSALVMFVGDGQVYCTVGSYLKSYVIEHKKFTHQQAYIITTVFLGVYVAWAGVSAFIQRRRGSNWAFLILAACNITATTIMWVWGDEFVAFCVAAALFGVGLSAKGSTMICWVADKIGNVTNVTLLIYSAGAVGDLVQGFLIGQLLEINPDSFILILFGGSCVIFLCFLVGQFVSKTCRGVREQSDPVIMVSSPVVMVTSPIAMVTGPVTMVTSPFTMVTSPVTMVTNPVAMVSSPV